jgi:hypothetical protein
MDRADARVGGRGLGAPVGPGLQIVERIDDAAAELSIGGAGAIGAVLFERSVGEAEEACGLGGSEVARRQAGGIGSHESGLRGFIEAAGCWRRMTTTVAKTGIERGWGIEGAEIPTPKPSRVRLSLPAMTQQLTIAPGDHGEAALDEGNDAVAQGRGLPMLGANALDAVNDIGDLAIGGAVQMCPSVAWSMWRWRRFCCCVKRRSAGTVRPCKARSRRSTASILSCRRRQAARARRVGCWLRTPARRTRRMVWLPALSRKCTPCSSERGVVSRQLGEEVAGRRQNGWRVREQHGAGVRLGGPEHRTLASSQRRRDEKTAGPISDGARASGEDYRHAHSPAGIRDCA